MSLKFKWKNIGNNDRLLELENDFVNKKTSHAYLFAGPVEVGKFTAAKFFAKLFICKFEACGECDDCKLIRTNSHPNLTIADILWIEGINEDLEVIAKKSNFNQSHRTKTPKAKTDTIRIEDLREILSRLNHKNDGWNIFVIRNIERMNRESTNFFLKTLEEPPKNTVFILTTNSQPLILPTIISRCRVLNFGNVNPQTIDLALQKDFPNLTDVERKRVVGFSMGKPIRAERLAKDPTIFREFKEYFEKLKNLLEKPDNVERLELAEKISLNSKELEKFLEAFTYFLRGFMLTRAKKPIESSRYTPQKLVELIRKLNLTRELIKKNVNPRLAVENLLIQI